MPGRRSRVARVIAVWACCLLVAAGLEAPAAAKSPLMSPVTSPMASAVRAGTTVPHPDGPSTRQEYVPGTVGPGRGAMALPLSATLTVSGTGARDTYSITPAVYGTVSSSAGGTVQAFFYVRDAGSGTWNIANGTEVDVASGAEALWRLGDQMGTAGGSYEWQMKACQSGSCSALTSIKTFTIDAQVAAGNRAFFGYYDQQLSKSASLHVNYASGNLVVNWSDLNIAGVDGLNLAFSRTYNSITDSGLGYTDFGQQWTNALVDLTAGTQTGGSPWILGPSGYLAQFIKSGTATYTPVPGLDADIAVSGTAKTVTFHHATDGFRAGDVLSFSGAALNSIADKHGNKISLSYSGGHVIKLTDTQGRTVSLSNYNAAGQAQTVTDNAGGRTLSYGYDGSGNLTSFADAGVAAAIAGDARASTAMTAIIT